MSSGRHIVIRPGSLHARAGGESGQAAPAVALEQLGVDVDAPRALELVVVAATDA